MLLKAFHGGCCFFGGGDSGCRMAPEKKRDSWTNKKKIKNNTHLRAQRQTTSVALFCFLSSKLPQDFEPAYCGGTDS